MTPLESELLQNLGIVCLYNVAEAAIGIFYGVSSLLVAPGPPTSLIKRCLCCTFFCVGCHLYIRFLLPGSHLVLVET